MSRILNIAHRGARSLAPENTLAAGRRALDLGADMWEIDVSVTVDGALILMHDDTLERTTNAPALFPAAAPWAVHEFSLAQIKTLDAGSFYVETDPFDQIAAGVVSPAVQAEMRGEPVPTLEEALRLSRDHSWPVNVEIKQLPSALDFFPVVEKVVNLIKKLDMVDQLLISSFEHDYLRRVKQMAPALKTGALCYVPSFKPVAVARRAKADAFHPHRNTILNRQITALREAGYAVNPWTVNDPGQMTRFIQAGVSGIITDFPQTLQPLLRR